MTTDALQLRLAPEAPLSGESRTVPLSAIRPPAVNLGAPADLVESIRTYGLLQPLLLVRLTGQDRYGYHVVAGARRWDALTRIAAEDPSRDAVPALVVQLDGWSGADILSAAENEHRRPNIVQTLETLERLRGAGATEGQIAQSLGMPPQRQRRVWRLHSLVPELRAAVLERRMTQAVAEQAARLSTAEQLDLAAAGRVTADMVHARRAATRGAAIEDLFEALGDEEIPGLRASAPADKDLPPPAGLGLTSETPAWRVGAVAAIRRAIHAVPPADCPGYGGGGSLATHLMCLVQAATSLGVDPASRYEILLTAGQREALRRTGWDEPGRARRRAS